MPKFDIPAEDNDSVNSSILSLSSTENGSASNRSLGSGSSLGLNNHSPPYPHTNELPRQIFNPLTNFQPTCRDPTLDAVLRKACTSDLDTLTHIQLRVSPNVFGLHQMHIFLPKLVALNLDGSSLESLRDLGCDLNLKYLNVSRCGLRSFDGISGFDTLEHLIADGNEISNVMQLGGLMEMHTLSLRGNNIKHLNAVSFLSMSPKLNNLDLTNNAVTEITDYRQKMKMAIPSLLILDGFGFDEFVSNANATDCSSSLTSDLSKDSTSSISELNTSSRPVSGTSTATVLIDSSKRPSTAESSSCSSSRSPIVGNIVNKVRRVRQGTKREQKQMDSTSTSLSSLIESNSKIHANGFPMVLQQNTVTLELGVINTEPVSTTQTTNANSEHDVHQLIEMCRRWRELSQKSRNKLSSKTCSNDRKK